MIFSTRKHLSSCPWCHFWVFIQNISCSVLIQLPKSCQGNCIKVGGKILCLRPWKGLILNILRWFWMLRKVLWKYKSNFLVVPTTLTRQTHKYKESTLGLSDIQPFLLWLWWWWWWPHHWPDAAKCLNSISCGWHWRPDKIYFQQRLWSWL